MSVRTRKALERHGLADPYHRSRQIEAADVAASDLLLIMEPSHLHWMRRRLPEALPLAASLRRMARDLPTAPGTTLAERVAALGLAGHEFEPWEEVIDPGAGEQDVFDACIDELADLIDDLVPTLREAAVSDHRREGLILAIAVQKVVGVTFGVLADAAGLTLPQVIVMSTLVFTGASQTDYKP